MPFNILYKINPELELKLLFRLKLGYPLDLDNPKTYNEKLQWIKLYDKNPLMTKCCDKYTVREYIKENGYEKLLNKLLWQGYDPQKIPFEKLPERFVIKVTHGSTFNIICTNKSKLDKKKIISKCKKWLNFRFLPCYGEWFYGVEKPRIIIEEYLEGENGMPLFDYKFFCFNGIPQLAYIDTWKGGKHSINAYDMNCKRIDGVELGYPCDSETCIEKPAAWNEMKEIAATLSKAFTHVRVDLYYTHGKIYFGELTFTKGAGFSKIRPYEFDLKMGKWMELV